MLPKPSLVLQVKLVPSQYSEAAAAEIKRSFMYQAQSIVSEAPEPEQAEGNVMRLSIRLMKPYWNREEAGAEELWRASFMPWLTNITRNMSTAMHNFNTVAHPAGSGNVTYEWADYDFGPHGILRVKVDDENRLPSCAPQLCDRLRDLAASGELGDEVGLVRAPSRESLEAQRRAYAEELAAYEEAKAAYDEALAAAEAEEACADDDAAASLEAPVPPAPFALNYDEWAIERTDGTVSLLHSQRA